MKIKNIAGIVLGAVVVASAGWWFLTQPKTKLLRVGTENAGAGAQAFSYEDYATVLGAHVSDQGMVDYKAMKAGTQKLDAFASAMGQLEPTVYNRWSEEEQIAFWINAYNALTLEAVLDHYPIESSLFKSLLFPKNSIRQIPGVWDKVQFVVMGRKMTLDQIEHEILRKQFNEPRIHMALVCAAMGCPALRNEPFRGDQLDDQLADQTRRFLSDPKKFRLDHSQGRVYLSSIFNWFGEDFVKTYGTDETFSGHGPAERAVLNFISQHLDPRARE